MFLNMSGATRYLHHMYDIKIGHGKLEKHGNILICLDDTKIREFSNSSKTDHGLVIICRSLRLDFSP